MHTKFKNSVTVKTVLDIFNNVESKENTLNLKPNYQRNVVWSVEDKSAFIDSLYRNIVPTNIVLNNNEDGTSECIDGKQRITSIIEFKKNMFPLILYDTLGNCDEEHIYFSKIPDDIATLNANFRNRGNKKQRVIKQRVFEQDEKNNFNRIDIPVVTYGQLNYCDRVDIFSRIQNGKKLTQGENMAACLSSNTICEIFNSYCLKFEKYFKGFSKIDVNRCDHKFIISYVYYMFETGEFSGNGKNRIVTCMRRIKENSSKVFTKKLDHIDAIFKICFGDTIFKNPKLANIDITMDLMYAVIMYVRNNVTTSIVDVDNDIVKTIILLHNRYHRPKNGTKKPGVSELHNEFVETVKKLKSSREDSDDELEDN